MRERERERERESEKERERGRESSRSRFPHVAAALLYRYLTRLRCSFKCTFFALLAPFVRIMNVMHAENVVY